MNGELPYSSWLVASDIDSTLNNKKRELPPENLKAVQDFVAKGGKFTLASDRNPELMTGHFDKLPISGTPAVVMGGAGIYDFTERKLLRFKPLSAASVEAAVNIAKKFPTLDFIIDTKDKQYIAGIGFWAHFYLRKSHATHEYFRRIEDVPREDWGKIVFFGPMWRARQIGKALRAVEGREYSVIDSSIVSVQIQAKGANKGTAVMEIAEMLGIAPDHTAAIGDYYNDYQMISLVEISGCTASAPKELKEKADYVACHCNKGAVADFLGYLTEKIKKIKNN